MVPDIFPYHFYGYVKSILNKIFTFSKGHPMILLIFDLAENLHMVRMMREKCLAPKTNPP